MLIRTYSPWSVMDRIQREMNQLFDDSYRSDRFRYPAVNMWTNDRSAVVTAELPGFSSKDIDISILDKTVMLKGKREIDGEKATWHRQERMSGEFERSFELPFPVEVDKVKASFDNGILSITLPRAEADKPRKIEIKST
ncbi:Hsp20 family protein [candidate division KSB1 bacterium]|nr:Hsp20 family protein [candidate division KSB1 bacterium]